MGECHLDVSSPIMHISSVRRYPSQKCSITAPSINLLKVGRSAEDLVQSVKILKRLATIGISFFRRKRKIQFEWLSAKASDISVCNISLIGQPASICLGCKPKSKLLFGDSSFQLP